MATLQDIAKKVGCSKTTVSLAMRESPEISEVVRKRILKTANDLSYIPHFAAKQLATGNKSGLIGLYLSGMSYDDIWMLVATELLRRLNNDTHKPMLGVNDGNINNNAIKESSWFQTFIQLNIEALIIMSYNIEDVSLPDRLKSKSPLFVGVEPPEKGCVYNYIALDRGNAAKMAVEHLLSRGRKNIAIANHDIAFASEAVNFAIAHGAKAQCYDFNIYHDVRHRIKIATDLAESIASKSIKPDACFLGDSPVAALFVNCLISKGIKVPDDIAVVGYDYSPMSDFAIVPLTTVEQPVDIIINETIDSVFSILKDEKQQVKRQKIIQHRLVVRKST